jgi:hypothetical protein
VNDGPPKTAHTKVVTGSDGKRRMVVIPNGGTCATCRFQGTQTRDRYDEDGNEIPLPHRNCLRIIHGNKDETDTATWAAMVCDGSGYAASLWTLPTFGCSLWERR